MKLTSLFASLLLVFLSGCATTPTASPGRRYDGTVHRLKEDSLVGVYTSKPRGFSTHSYWIEGPEGLVVIDTQFLPSAAHEVLELAERETGKKVVLAVVLHPNPDKFNGTSVFQARGIRVVTAQQVLERIPAVFELRTRWFKDRYAPDWPEAEPRPEAFGAETTVLEAAGLKLKAHVMGPGCSDAQVVVEWEGHLFTGDLVANGTHAWLELGLQHEWLQRLDELARLNPRHVHPGRGPSAGPELLSQQRAYLEKVIELVRAAEPTLPVRDEAVAEAVQRVLATYPKLDLAVFLRVGMAEVYRREAELRAKAVAH
ncbi:MBL fold metallo-hydrolase [Archangium lansingense]|uniref:MBL fold metallo-hydrolase n=1 Tax=Archangium lansingense TaxID=2995310 RepID=A0ABT4ADE0_9BACT|nr:MBL fold metallo-hydrolase [Archangium lansinium]MCY1078924.1 MBL fold metallo-hydrolase [Archangium lansinium]